MAVQAEMAGSSETAAILDALNPTRTSARERQGETERRIREEARRLAAEGGAAGTLIWFVKDDIFINLFTVYI